MKRSYNLPTFSNKNIGVIDSGLPEVGEEQAENAKGGYNPVDGGGTQELIGSVTLMLIERQRLDEEMDLVA